jgi:hypothetical protein
MSIRGSLIDWRLRLMKRKSLVQISFFLCGHVKKKKDVRCYNNEAKGILNSFQSWSVQHVRRSNNETAHCLAKKALSLREEHVIIEDISSMSL